MNWTRNVKKINSTTTIFITIAVMLFALLTCLLYGSIIILSLYYENKNIEATRSKVEKHEAFPMLPENKAETNHSLSTLNPYIGKQYLDPTGYRFYEMDNFAYKPLESNQYTTNEANNHNVSAHKQQPTSSNESSSVREALEELAPYIGIAIASLSILSSIIYTKFIAKPYVQMDATLKEIMNLKFEDGAIMAAGTMQMKNRATEVKHVVTTLQKKNEELKRELTKHQERDQSQKELMSVISHELKSPITAVMGQLDGMIHGVGIYKDRDTYLKKSYEMVQNINELTEELNDVAKLQNSHFEPHIVKVELSHLIHTIIQKADYFVQMKRLYLHTNIQPNINISADKKYIETAISNIISNAIQYTIDRQHVYITLYEKPNGYILEVMNTGSQIEDDKLARVFEPFYRAGGGKHSAVKGSGFGLYMVKQILDNHHFPYGIQNTSQGVKFAITFPKSIS
ncbi:hypothetical protein BAMA_00130 [Bacillus manliponensis]|uniref:histidine kinase n=1 Tax=Bacillus manliponensis TaxID=574376 RepID=A0A073K3P5_9BACI|nr:hypothetical protein BAMA_00130 [Bacillus manliponensis]